MAHFSARIYSKITEIANSKRQRSLVLGVASLDGNVPNPNPIFL